MTPNRLISIVFIVLGLALIGAGCGGDDKGSSPSPTKAEFVRKGNAICTNGNKKIDAKGRKLFGGQQKKPSESQLKKFATDVLIPEVQKQVDQIRDLGAPKGDEKKVKAILDAAQQGIDKAKKDPIAITQDNGADPFQKANKLARDYGLTVCGSS